MFFSLLDKRGAGLCHFSNHTPGAPPDHDIDRYQSTHRPLLPNKGGR